MPPQGVLTRPQQFLAGARIRVGQCESCRRHDQALIEIDVDDVVMPFEVCARCTP